MEESEKRRERLKAMHMEEAQSEKVGDQGTSTSPGYLVNPLAQPCATPQGAERSPPAPRFDYYTDPMSAFSGSKRRSNNSACNPPDNFSSPFRGSLPMSHLPPSYSAGPRKHYMTPAPANQFQVNNSPHQGSYMTPSPTPQYGSPTPQYGSWRSPVNAPGPFSGHSPVSVPGILDGSGSSFGYGPPHFASRGGYTSPGFGRGPSTRGCFTSPGFGRGPSPRGGFTSPGRGSSSTNSGRGNNWRFGNSQSPRSGWNSGGGRGSNVFVSAREKPEPFYCKAMVGDPWDKLEPVVGCILVPLGGQRTPDSLRSWLPRSITEKKVRRVAELDKEFHSQSSLAEYIALSFEEAVNDPTDL